MKEVTYSGARDGLFFWRCKKCGDERFVSPPVMPQTDTCRKQTKAGECGGAYTAHVLRAAR